MDNNHAASRRSENPSPSTYIKLELSFAELVDLWRVYSLHRNKTNGFLESQFVYDLVGEKGVKDLEKNSLCPTGRKFLIDKLNDMVESLTMPGLKDVGPGLYLVKDCNTNMRRYVFVTGKCKTGSAHLFESSFFTTKILETNYYKYRVVKTISTSAFAAAEQASTASEEVS